MITKGAKVLVIAAIDGTTLADTLQKAADAGIKVFAYDRLIRDIAERRLLRRVRQLRRWCCAGDLDRRRRSTSRTPPAPSTSSCSPARRTTTTPGSSSTARCRSASRSSTAASSSSSRARPSSRARSAPCAGTATTAQTRMDNILSTHYATEDVRRGPVAVRRHQPRHHRLAQAGRLLHRGQARPGRHRPGRGAPVREVDPRRRADLDGVQGHPPPGRPGGEDGRPVPRRSRRSRSTTPRPTTTASRSSRRTCSRSVS